MRNSVSRWRAGLASAAAAALLLAACSTGDVLPMRPEADVGGAQSAALGRGLQRLVPSDPLMVGFPRLNTPADPVAAMPSAETECRRDLKRLGVKFRNLAPIHDGGACRIDWPVEISAINGVEMKPAATLSCAMAATFSSWTREELQPAARLRYLSGVKTIHQGSSYSCRTIRGSGRASQHSVGNALDVMRIELKNGRDIDVRKPGWFAFRQRGFLNSVRADGCDHVSTVLGPGYDADHADQLPLRHHAEKERQGRLPLMRFATSRFQHRFGRSTLHCRTDHVSQRSGRGCGTRPDRG